MLQQVTLYYRTLVSLGKVNNVGYGITVRSAVSSSYPGIKAKRHIT